MKVVWTEQAFARLAEIHDVVASDSPQAAGKLVDRLPGRGRRIPEFPGVDLREVVEGNYRLVYRIRPDRIEVITVFEGHRLPPLEDAG